MSAILTDQQLDKIIGAINEVGAFSVTDAVTLSLALTSLVVALAAARFTMHQRDVVAEGRKVDDTQRAVGGSMVFEGL